jgi:hypothetical protein
MIRQRRGSRKEHADHLRKTNRHESMKRLSKPLRSRCSALLSSNEICSRMSLRVFADLKEHVRDGKWRRQVGGVIPRIWVRVFATVNNVRVTKPSPGLTRWNTRTPSLPLHFYSFPMLYLIKTVLAKHLHMVAGDLRTRTMQVTFTFNFQMRSWYHDLW